VPVAARRWAICVGTTRPLRHGAALAITASARKSASFLTSPAKCVVFWSRLVENALICAAIAEQCLPLQKALRVLFGIGI
jgi:hypothetical protein